MTFIGKTCSFIAATLCLLSLSFCTPNIEPAPLPDKPSDSSIADLSSSSLAEISGRSSSSKYGQSSSSTVTGYSSSRGSSSSSSVLPSSSSSVPSYSSNYSSISAPSSSSVSAPLSSSATQCKFNFFSNPENIQNIMCVATICNYEEKNGCGPQLIEIGYSVDFYMVNRVTRDTAYLSPARGSQKRYSTCTGTINDFKCNGAQGITVSNAVYTCGGIDKCRGSAQAIDKAGIIGSWNVYVRLMTKDGKPVEGAKPIMIDSFKSESNTRIVWGTLYGMDSGKEFQLKDTHGNITKREQTIVAGEHTPIYISIGSWTDDNYNIFEYDDDPDVAGKSYSLSIIGGATEQKINGVLPASGVDTLWIEKGIGEFFLNVVPESASAPSMKLTVNN